MAPGTIAPKFFERVTEHRTMLSKQLALVPSRVGFWLKLEKTGIKKRLDRIQQMHKDIFDDGQVEYLALPKDPQKRNALHSLLAEISRVAKIVRETGTP
jgi:hypothetical protein